MKHMLASVVVSSMLLTACGGGGSSDETDSTPSTGDGKLSTVSMTTPFALSQGCPNGGIEVSTGIDDNGDGKLDATEIDNTQSVCHGSNGNSGSSSLITTNEELAGANCTNGGLRIDIGMDSNSSGALDTFEITTTQYVCDGKDSGTSGSDGANGLASLIDMTDEPAGDNCNHGGLLITTGIDTDSSGVLDQSEVTNSRYICNSDGGAIVETSDFYQCDDNDLCMIYGQIDRDFTLTADKTWLMTEAVYVGSGNRFILSEEDAASVQADGVTLTIEPGTEIQALPDTTLVITRGSKLMAEGTAEAPINFSAYSGQLGFQKWQGVRLQGLAEFYPYIADIEEGSISCADESFYCNVSSSYGYFGGNLNNDNSGVIKHVTISGADRSLTLASTGYNTTIENLQMTGNDYYNLFVAGGTTNLSHINSQSNRNGFYFGYGYKGNIQHIILNQKFESEVTSFAIRLAGGGTQITASNVLIIGYDNPKNTENYSSAFKTGNSKLTVYNTVIHGDRFESYSSCLDNHNGYYDENDIWTDNFPEYQNLINGTFYDCSDSDGKTIESAYITIDSSGALVTEETVSVTNWQPVDNGSGFVFDNTNYVGAVAPGTAMEDAWWYGWTIEGSMDELETPDHLLPPVFVTCATVGTKSNETYTIGENALPICDLSGVISEDATLTGDFVYRLNGYVTVGNGSDEITSKAAVNSVTLTVNEGVQFRSSGRGSLIISRGSKLMANGTAANPIVMSSADFNNEGQGEWGGLVMQGYAKNNQCGEGSVAEICNVADEADTGFHGGNDDADNSGSVKYLIVAEGGFEIGPDEEVNGITLHSVGYGTTLENIMVFNNADDGIEFFGGAANVKNLILVDNGDESIDWDDGYRGNIQYALVRQGLVHKGDHGIEADNAGLSNKATPVSKPTLANVTFQQNSVGADDLFRFKLGTGGELVNIAADGYSECVRLEHPESGANTDGELTLTNVLLECDAYEGGSFLTLKESALAENITGVPTAATTVELGNAFEVTGDAAATLDTAADLNSANASTEFFDAAGASFIGAVNPTVTAVEGAWWNWAAAVLPEAFESSEAK